MQAHYAYLFFNCFLAILFELWEVYSRFGTSVDPSEQPENRRFELKPKVNEEVVNVNERIENAVVVLGEIHIRVMRFFVCET